MKSLFPLHATLAVCVSVSLVGTLPASDRGSPSASEAVRKEAPKLQTEKQLPTTPPAPQPQAPVPASKDAATLPSPNPVQTKIVESHPFTEEEIRQIKAAAGQSLIDPKQDVAERAPYLATLSRQMSATDDAVVRAALETVLGRRKLWPLHLQMKDDLTKTPFFYRWGFIVGTGKSQQTKEYVQFIDLVVSHEPKFPELVAQAFFILTDAAVTYDPTTHAAKHLVTPGFRFNQPGQAVKEFWEKTPLYSWR